MIIIINIITIIVINIVIIIVIITVSEPKICESKGKT